MQNWLAFFSFGGLFVGEIFISFTNSNNQDNYFLFNYFVNQAIAAGFQFDLVVIFEAVKLAGWYLGIL